MSEEETAVRSTQTASADPEQKSSDNNGADQESVHKTIHQVVSEMSKEQVALMEFKFSLIAPIISGTYTDSSETAYCRRITQNPLKYPDGTERSVSYKTIQKWAETYRKYGVDSLLPGLRSDKGISRALDETAIAKIYELKKQFPRANATQVYKKLRDEDVIPASVAVSAVQRFFKNHDLRSASNPQMRDRKAFEMAHFGEMWQADTCYLSYLTIDGKAHRLYAVGIIDDYSRYVVGAHLYLNDNAYNFQKVLKGGIAACGIPTMLYVDNGVPYANEQLSLICCALGIQLIHTKVRDGASKGCIERLWRTIRMDYEYMTDFTKFHSLEEADESFSAFIRKYNTTVHSAIGCTPQKRYQEDSGRIRLPKSREWMDEQFLNRQNRMVHKDATIRIDKESYDTPAEFIGQKVEVRYLPDDMDHAFILYNGEHYPVRRTDKIANAHTKRKNLPVDFASDTE